MTDLSKLWWRWLVCVAAAMGVVYLFGGNAGPVIPAMLGVLATLVSILWTDLTEPL